MGNTRIFILATLLIAGAALAGGDDMECSMEHANSLYQQGLFPQAQAIYEPCLESLPSDPRLLYQLGQLALLNNNNSQAIEYYQQALKHSGWLGRRWPMSSQYAARIAIAYYRQDDFANAARWYMRAAGPIAFGPFKPLRALQRQAEAFGDSQAYVITGPSATEIPFMQLDPLPIVEVSLNGQGPYYFFIDTGGADVLLTQEVADELNVPRRGKIKGDFAAGRPGFLQLGRLERIQIGEIQIANIPVNIHRFDGVDEILQHKIHGVVTTSLLRHFYSTIDYQNRKLVLKQLTSDNAAVIAKDAEAGIAIPFWLSELHMMMARGHINNEPSTLFFVDTGLANHGFAISRWLLEATGIELDWDQATCTTGAGGSFQTVNFSLDSITLGEGKHRYRRHQVSAERHEKDLNIYQGLLGFEVGGTISHGFFRDSSLSFDFRTMRLIIIPDEQNESGH